MNIDLTMKLASARHMVTSDAAVLDGTPVAAGTRAPVRDVAATLEEALLAEVLRRYPC